MFYSLRVCLAVTIPEELAVRKGLSDWYAMFSGTIEEEVGGDVYTHEATNQWVHDMSERYGALELEYNIEVEDDQPKWFEQAIAANVWEKLGEFVEVDVRLYSITEYDNEGTCFEEITDYEDYINGAWEEEKCVNRK